MSDSRRNWLSTGDIAKITGLSARHIARACYFKGWRINSHKSRRSHHHRFKAHPSLFIACEKLRREKSNAVALRRLEKKPCTRPGPIGKRELFMGAIAELFLHSSLQTDWSDPSSKAMHATFLQNLVAIVRECDDEVKSARAQSRQPNFGAIVSKWIADPNAWLVATDTKLPITTMTEMLERMPQLREQDEPRREVARKTPTDRGDPYSRYERDDLA